MAHAPHEIRTFFVTSTTKDRRSIPVQRCRRITSWPSPFPGPGSEASYACLSNDLFSVAFEHEGAGFVWRAVQRRQNLSHSFTGHRHAVHADEPVTCLDLLYCLFPLLCRHTSHEVHS